MPSNLGTIAKAYATPVNINEYNPGELPTILDLYVLTYDKDSKLSTASLVTVLNCVGYCATDFLLISSFVSPSPPPVAASAFENANEPLTVSWSVESNPDPKKLTEPELNIVKDCTETLDEARPPTKYSTVKVVFEGAIP